MEAEILTNFEDAIYKKVKKLLKKVCLISKKSYEQILVY